MDGIIIVSRHPAAVAFIRQAAQLPESVPVIASATADDVCGKVVYGNLPLHLAAHARAVVAVEFEGAPPRGAEYGLEEMIAAGARLQVYSIDRLGAAEPPALRAAIIEEDSDGAPLWEIDGNGRLLSPGTIREHNLGLPQPPIWAKD